MASRHVAAIHAGGDGLDALEITGKAEAHEVSAQMFASVLLAHRLVQLLEALIEAVLFRFEGGGLGPAKGRPGICRSMTQ